jgi:stearoyl-CoA desaturase (delta-9 desaturase)
MQGGEVIARLNLPHVPTREEFLAEARIMFAPTRSMNEIVDRAYDILLASIGARLLASAQHDPT